MGDAEKKMPGLLIAFGKGDDEEDTKALAGKALAKALGITKDVDGLSVYDAFKSMLDECDYHSESSEDSDDDDE